MAALIELREIRRDYPSGDGAITVLRDINLSIEAGEMVAIVGPSGSGKSTLMNILGLLDRPTSGAYSVGGQLTADLSSDDLAALRREHFGFIFQRYQLLSELTAIGNVEVPAIYAGVSTRDRHQRAADLLRRLGMAERLSHRPSQLSGGQQQRVAIARALINGGEVILADEPTGALDRQSGQDVLGILDDLHREGRTVIIVTHDMTVAARADRIIELEDGRIVKDTCKPEPKKDTSNAQESVGAIGKRHFGWQTAIGGFREALRMALLALRAHGLRTFLTMLGITIGIASVVCVVALGQGSQQRVLSNINSLGTNTLEIFPGKDLGDIRSGKVKTLVVSDSDALARLEYIAAVTPTVSTSTTVRFGATEANALINGVGEDYFAVKGSKLLQGRFFDTRSVRSLSQEAVIDQNTATTLFGSAGSGPIGRTIFAGKVPVTVVGVIASQQGGFGSSDNLSVYLPYTSVQARFLGDMSLRSVTVRIRDSVDASVAEAVVTQFLTGRHGVKDFFVLNTDDIRQTIASTSRTMTLLISSIAVISLLVGGIGVMNIMLVSVTERIAEIGVRIAVGARRQDVMQQFLIEAVLVCLLGGASGIAVALGFRAIFNSIGSDFGLVYSVEPIVLAFACSCLIGVAFGFLPARNASRLDPVVALARD